MLCDLIISISGMKAMWFLLLLWKKTAYKFMFSSRGHFLTIWGCWISETCAFLPLSPCRAGATSRNRGVVFEYNNTVRGYISLAADLDSAVTDKRQVSTIFTWILEETYTPRRYF
jgi:hypothetical protein